MQLHECKEVLCRNQVTHKACMTCGNKSAAKCAMRLSSRLPLPVCVLLRAFGLALLASHTAGRCASLQVPVQGQHQSCCAVVENCQRCMFFIPQPGVFTSAKLATLEAEAATDPSQKIALIRHLHVRLKFTCFLHLIKACWMFSLANKAQQAKFNSKFQSMLNSPVKTMCSQSGYAATGLSFCLLSHPCCLAQDGVVWRYAQTNVCGRISSHIRHWRQNPNSHRWLPQELAAELKAEAREVLRQHGVDNFVLKPVRRSYAFELAEIPRGEQWVLKVRYPASKPPLPLGLSGAPYLPSLLRPYKIYHARPAAQAAWSPGAPLAARLTWRGRSCRGDAQSMIESTWHLLRARFKL